MHTGGQPGLSRPRLNSIAHQRRGARSSTPFSGVIDWQKFASQCSHHASQSCVYVLNVSHDFRIADVPVVLFVVVNGVPSVGIQVMCGSGKIKTQTVIPVQRLPLSDMAQQRKKSSGASVVVLSARCVFLV